MARRAAQWGVLLLAAILGGLAALSFDRGLQAMRPTPTPGLTPTAPLPTREPPVVVVLPTTQSTVAPTPAPGDPVAEIAALRGALAQQGGLLLIARAERHAALALDAFVLN